jgi:hypothetical protein
LAFLKKLIQTKNIADNPTDYGRKRLPKEDWATGTNHIPQG